MTRRYGAYRYPEDTARCVVSVHEGGRSVNFKQCGRYRGHGPEGLYCKQHAKAVAAGEYVKVPKEEEARSR